MIKAPPTVLTPEAIGFGFILWLCSIGVTSLLMNLGKAGEGWMFAVMSWPLVLGFIIIVVERTLFRLRGGDPNALPVPDDAPAASPTPTSDDSIDGPVPGLARAS